MNTFYRHDIFSGLSSTGNLQKHYVLEIGAGYGGLAHHLLGILGNVTYFIVDLPETLLFSASYLSSLNPGKSIYIYDSNDFSEFINSNRIQSYDFILIPRTRSLALAYTR